MWALARLYVCVRVCVHLCEIDRKRSQDSAGREETKLGKHGRKTSVFLRQRKHFKWQDQRGNIFMVPFHPWLEQKQTFEGFSEAFCHRCANPRIEKNPEWMPWCFGGCKDKAIVSWGAGAGAATSFPFPWEMGASPALSSLCDPPCLSLCPSLLNAFRI